MLSVIAPVRLGVFYLKPYSYLEWGIPGLFSALALISASVFAITRPKRWRTVVAHVALLFYWLMSITLLGTGI